MIFFPSSGKNEKLSNNKPIIIRNGANDAKFRTKPMASNTRNSQNKIFKRIAQKGISPAMSLSSEEPQFTQAKAALLLMWRHLPQTLVSNVLEQ